MRVLRKVGSSVMLKAARMAVGLVVGKGQQMVQIRAVDLVARMAPR